MNTLYLWISFSSGSVGLFLFVLTFSAIDFAANIERKWQGEKHYLIHGKNLK